MGSKAKNINKKDKAFKSKSYLADDQNYGGLSAQLAKLGLDIREITGDGNCLFRALSDQIEGNENQHLVYRKLVCQYIKQNQDNFEPFLPALIHDEENINNFSNKARKHISAFDMYIKNLELPGTYADNCCLVAFSQLYQLDLNIHQLNLPIWSIIGTKDVRKGQIIRQLHLAYHNGEHYSSIRRIGDKTETPTDISLGTLKTDSNGSNSKKSKSKNYMATAAKLYESDDYDECNNNDGSIDMDIDRIMNVTNCNDIALITDILIKNNHDVESTIMNMIETMKLKTSGEPDNENRTNDASNKKSKKSSKSEKKRDKKARQMERHRQKFLQNNNQSTEGNDECNEANFDIPSLEI